MSDVYVRKLTDRNLKRWKEDFPFLSKHPDSANSNAYCKLCKQSLTPKINVIRHHSSTKSHQILSKCASEPDLMTTESGRPEREQHLFDIPRDETLQVVTHAVVGEDGLIIENYTTTEKVDIGPDIEAQEVAPFNSLIEHQEHGSVAVVNTEDNLGKSIAKISANAQFPFYIEKEIQRSFFTMQGYDALWKCDGGIFKLHRFVVSLYSSYLRGLLEACVDEENCMIFTPDLSSLMVKSFLCLCYTGSVLLPSEDQARSVIKLFDELGCKGKLDLQRKRMKKLKDEDIVDRVRGTKRKTTSQKHNKTKKRVKKGKESDELVEEASKDLDESPVELTQVVIVNENMDATFENETAIVYEYEDNAEGVWKDRKDETTYHTDEETATVEKDIGMSVKKEDKIKLEVEEVQDYDPLQNYQVSNLMLPQEEDKENRLDWEPIIDIKKQPKERSRDSTNRYFMIGSCNGLQKGKLSAKLKEDLLDDPPDDQITSLHVCHLCYQVFPFIDAFNLHMEEKHLDKRPRHGRFYKGENLYHCPTCNNDIAVIHLIWFVKHLKFCGADTEKAEELLRPGDSDTPATKEVVKDLYAEDMLTGKPKNKGYASLCDLLLGRFNHRIFGCRTCYEAFSEKDDLIHHYNSLHGGKLEYGPCYDEKSKLYTCTYCSLVMKKAHLVQFIRHIRQCLVDPSLAFMRNNEEEGMDDDDTQDTIDPWGVINRPLRVSNLRSEWICESLFGRFYPILFPCHICYTVFKQEQDIKQHFSENHINEENCVENGSLYDKDKDCYTCPNCKKDVCKNQKSSIYFTYHMRKCTGDTHPVTKTCDKCKKSFNKYNTLTNHQLYFCDESGSSGFICHICSTVIKTKRELDTHVKYVHSNVRQFQCEHCQKSFKRKGDLVVHQQTHTETPGFFCEKCGKSFFKKRNLKSHLSTHDTSDASKKHECYECGRRFIRLQALKNHLTTHSNERLYSCEVCGARVKTPGTLMTHRKKVHKLTTPFPKMSVQDAPAMLEHSAKVTTTLLETSEIQHAPNEGAAILLIKTEKIPSTEEDNMPHLM